MLTETAKVLSIDNTSVLLEAQSVSHCSSCSARAGCGHRVLSKLLPHRSRQLSVPAEGFKGKPGDSVIIGIDENAVLRLSILYYLFPLGIMIFSILLTDFLGLNELAIILSALSGLVLGFFWLAFIGRRNRSNPRYQAVLCRH